MSQHLHLDVLREAAEETREALSWLCRSYEQCRSFSCVGFELPPEAFDALEALTSRFARVSDMLLQKLFRALDVVDLEQGGTLLDVLLRAEKRGLVQTADAFLLIRELRNEIAHEYASQGLRDLLRSVLDRCPELILIVERTLDYARQRVETLAKDQTPDAGPRQD